MKTAIIYQGPITQYTYDNLRNVWGDTGLYISTWEGNPIDAGDDCVIYSKLPNWKGPHNFNLQKHSTLTGLNHAMLNSHTHALKIRTDMWPTNPQSLLDCMEVDKLNLFAWHNHLDGYITDYLMFGRIDDLINLWECEGGDYPEWGLTKKWFQTGLDKNTHFFLDSINEDNDIHWIQNGEYKKLSDYHNIKAFTTKVEYNGKF